MGEFFFKKAALPETLKTRRLYCKFPSHSINSGRLIDMRVLFFATITWFITFSFDSAIAQTNELLVGRWEYDQIRLVDESEPFSQSMLKIVVGSNSYFHFAKNHEYVINQNNAVSAGQWRLSDNNTKLILTSDRGNITTYEIISLTKNTLVFLIKDKAYHTLTRAKDSHHDAVQHPRHDVHTVRATSEQILKKWVLVELEDSLGNQEVNKKMTEFVKGGWYEFKNNGYYAKKMITREKNGEWKFQNDNRTIIMMDEDGFGAVWNICFISSARLVLQKPGSSVRHVFTPLQ